MESSRVRLAADVGGTFTDVAAFDETTGELRLGKTLTTPARLVTGVESGVTKAGAQFSRARLFLHGTTVAINTILERTGAPCALLTTQGFRDIYEIGRVNRPESYNLFFRRHQPLIERDLRYEIRERIDAHGKVLIELDEDRVRAAVADAVRQRVEAIAILFLHSYRNPAHEQRVKAIIEEGHPHLFVTASHELSQEYREFERTSTAAANAYIGPRVRRYLGEIGDHLAAAGFDGDFLIVQSTGGLFGVEEAQSACIRMLESGPAAGVIGTKALCDRIGLKNAIAFDMGGTTAKAGVIHGGDVLMTGGALIGGYATGLPVQIPMIDIQEVGTGGGSIARTEMGALHVGPESAGAQPGPVCYGLGGVEPTITDANLILGRLSADRFLGGEIKLDVEGARRALEARVATPLGLDLTAAADGILRIATTKMSHMVRWVTTERGLDAADFTLVAYGGAGPLHAAMVARELRIAKVVVPRAPGHFSAYGMLVAELRRDFVKTWFTPLAEASFPAMENIYAEMERAVARPCAAATSPSPASRSSARRTCVMSGRSTRSPSSSRSSCSGPRIATELKPASMPFTRPATAIRLPARRPRSSACAARSRVSCASRHSSPSPRARPRRRLKPFAAPARFISLNWAVPWIRRVTIARRCSPKIVSPDPR
jgi:N-methylhydantoinase A